MCASIGVTNYIFCYAVPCEDSPEVEGAKRKSCNNPGCFVIYSCKQEEGWELVSGKGYRICGKDGKWINELPVCARKYNTDQILYNH